MRLFNAGAVDRVMDTAQVPDDVPIEAKLVTKRRSQQAQGQVEAQNFEIRKNVLKYDDVMNRQRQVIYGERRAVLEGEDLHEQVRDFVDDVVDGYVDAATAEGFPEDWDLDALWTALSQLYPVALDRRGRSRTRPAAVGAITAELLREELMSDAQRGLRPARGDARRGGACASSSAGSCSPCSTASGASTSTRWTTSRRASACARWPSATRSSSTSARASTCSTR